MTHRAPSPGATSSADLSGAERPWAETPRAETFAEASDAGAEVAVAGAAHGNDARRGGRGHQGTDMMADYGTPTVAPVSGTVEHRGSSLGGLSWYLYGDDGDMYYGTHLSGYANQGVGHVAARHRGRPDLQRRSVRALRMGTDVHLERPGGHLVGRPGRVLWCPQHQWS